ncbi:diguanylate cyclase [Thiohalophilus thiocyanatoxydans]|uniref:Diguanylate cyclase DosC n=1 Tax=Thiohalophilus thiocyanatoxydans TaxID=381308 RepID=A0A4R8IPF8_9GAMM|nr:diguanylate cyclase [Thiohalophilus thiocyanatoxydans]TDY02811.1 diguanylate cyclase (GGDEF)-like protein [Thiohalophilus thiocyanatoxydans]
MMNKQTNIPPFNLSYDARKSFLELFELSSGDKKLADILQRHVIQPNVDEIVDKFYDFMLSHDRFRPYLEDKVLIARLKKSQRNYLYTLGVEFDTPNYFEERIHVGTIHKQVGLPTTLYQSAYTKLLGIIIDKIPASNEQPGANRRELESFARRITAFDMSLAIHSYHVEHIQEMQVSLNTLRTEGAQLRDQVTTDELTGVHTRNSIMEIFSRMLTQSRSQKTNLSLAMVDLDHFKQINDTHGHLAGDKVLKEVGEKIQGLLRSEDFVGRYGGEEFMIILNNTDLAGSNIVMERLRSSVSDNPIEIDDDQHIQVTLSAGVTTLREEDDEDSFFHRADEALYEAKNGGRNRVVSR